MKRTSALRPILFPGSSPTWQELGRHVLRQHTLCIPQQEKGGGRGQLRRDCYNVWTKNRGRGPPPPPHKKKKKRETPPPPQKKKKKNLKPERKVNFAKGYSPIWPQPLCAAEQGMVFRMLGLEQVRYTISLFSLLYEVPFWTASLKMSVNFGILISWVTVTIHHDNGGLLSCLLCEELHAL